MQFSRALFLSTPSTTHQRDSGMWVRSIISSLALVKSHDAFDAGAVVPAAVEQHDFAGRRQMRYVTLKIPLGALALGRGRQCDDLADPRVEPLGDALDHPALAGGVTALEQHD